MCVLPVKSEMRYDKITIAWWVLKWKEKLNSVINFWEFSKFNG